MSIPAPPPAPPAPPKKSGLSKGKVALIAAVTFVVGVGVGVIGSPEEDNPPEAAASPSAESEVTASLPPAAGATGASGTTGVTGTSGATGVTNEPVGSSLDNPIPPGGSAEVGQWQVKVVGLTKNADAVVERENTFNEKPKAGNQYVMVTLKTTYIGNGSEDPVFGLSWAAVSQDGTLYEADTSQVLPKDLYNVGNVPSGVSGVGNVLFEVPKGVVDSIVLYMEGETASFDTEGAYLALT